MTRAAPIRAHVQDLMGGERILWTGRPAWKALARDLIHLRLIALYFAVTLIYGAYLDRASGLGPVQAMLSALPLLLLAVAVLAVGCGVAFIIARTTRYTLTNERCIIDFGVALTATLSLPLHRIAAVAVATRADGTGDIPLRFKPGPRIAFPKLWPHARPWRLRHSEPMLRSIPDALHVATLFTGAVSAVSPGQLHPLRPLRAVAPLGPAVSVSGD